MADAGDQRRMLRIAARIQSHGVVVRFVDGWEERGRTFEFVPRGIVDHHDASTRKTGEWGFLGAITYGRKGSSPVPGPLSQFQVARGLDGVPKVAIVAAGRANHAGRGGPLELPGGFVVPAGKGNELLYGMEKANDGLHEPHTEAAHFATDVTIWSVLAECRGQGVERCIGHKDWTGRKADPVYDMEWRRSRVAALDDPIIEEDSSMVTNRVLVKDPDSSDQYLVVLGTSRKKVPSWADYLVYKDVLKIPTTVLTAAELRSLPDITVRSTT